MSEPSNIHDMSLDELRSVPFRKWNEDIGPFRSLVIIPASVSIWDRIWFNLKTIVAKTFGISRPEIWQIPGMHDSGYLCMSFVAADENGGPIAQLGGCSDVIHIGGVGGLGHNWLERYGTVPARVPPKEWSIDALPNSGCLRLFSSRNLFAGTDLSSFEIFAEEKERG